MKAYFAAGCFWGVEASFKELAGVNETTVGYMNGDTENPTYEQICNDHTGHAESVEINFDESIITFEELVKHFYSLHNPTTLNQQGPDIGSQYRSAIFYVDESQAAIAEQVTKSAQSNFSDPIVTEITPAAHFWPAEDYHQDYFDKNPGSCHF